MVDKKKDAKVEGGYIIRAEVRRKDGTIIRPKKALPECRSAECLSVPTALRTIPFLSSAVPL